MTNHDHAGDDSPSTALAAEGSDHLIARPLGPLAGPGTHIPCRNADDADPDEAPHHAHADALDDDLSDPGADARGGGRASRKRRRHDGFAPDRRRLFLQTLASSGCVTSACRAAHISDSAAYKARRRDPVFAALWDSAMASASSPIDLLAWQRAVEGVEEPIIAYGKMIGTRRRFDQPLFRAMAKGADPQRYGVGISVADARAIEKRVRAEIEAERDFEIDEDAARRRLETLFDGVRRQMLATGEYFEAGDGSLIPVKYRGKDKEYDTGA